MFEYLEMKNVGVFSHFKWERHHRINIVVGENDTGKSHVLKMLYAFAKSLEDYARRNLTPPQWGEALSTKLLWTFQPPKGLSDLVRRSSKELTVNIRIDGASHEFSALQIGPIAVLALSNQWPRVTTLFIPPKELLTSFSAIAVTRETLEIFGFDDTYYDLIKALRVPATQGQLEPEMQAALDTLEQLFRGRIVKDRSSDTFQFERGADTFAMTQTADGIKKVGILETLIRNRTLNRRSIFFLDEPEVNLHPRAISVFTRVLFELARAGVQIYLATHSYFVLKELQLLAQEHDESIAFCSLLRRNGDIEAEFFDLKDGMPENPIVDASVELYRREIAQDLGPERKQG